jgi:hypothetical protein
VPRNMRGRRRPRLFCRQSHWKTSPRLKPPSYRYNSFEFSYRQDFGKIVLVRQKPDTGELVQQFPSEYYLRKYADSQRVAQSAVDQNAGARSGGDAKATVTQSRPAVSTPSVSPAPQQPAPSAAPAAPTISAAPALPSGGVGSNAALNLTV